MEVMFTTSQNGRKASSQDDRKACQIHEVHVYGTNVPGFCRHQADGLDSTNCNNALHIRIET